LASFIIWLNSTKNNIFMKINKFLSKQIFKSFLIPILISLIIAILLQSFFIKSYKYIGGSMEPSLRNGDFILVSKTKDIESNDIILLKNILNSDNLLTFKRCVAVAGDSFRIKNCEIYVNNKHIENKNETKNLYRILALDTLSKYLIANGLYTSKSYSVTGLYAVSLTKNEYLKIKKDTLLKNIINISIPEGYNNSKNFPYSYKYRWNKDNFGTIIIPKKGQTIELNQLNAPLYKQIISEEQEQFSYENNKYVINNEEVKNYTFEQDYYFVLNDNRLDENDSRTWGFVAKNNIVGKAKIVWFSNDSIDGINWKRILKKL